MRLTYFLSVLMESWAYYRFVSYKRGLSVHVFVEGGEISMFV